MPRFNPADLRTVGYTLFAALGCRPDDARAVVDHLVESNLFGHDSHGAIRFYEYAQAVGDGRFQPQAEPVVVRDKPCLAVVDAGGAMGQVGATFATRLAIDKARQHGVGAVSLRNTSHIGRVGAYPLMVAREGMIGQIFVNAGHMGHQAVPFGGIDGRLSTNPIAFAAPLRDAEPLLVDMTTSVVAEGKIRVALNKGEHVPEGWIIDSQGNPTTDPQDFKGDPPGAMLPMGGVVAHKGYALSLMVEILGGALSGLGCASGAPTMTSNGVFLQVYNIEHFVDMEDYYREVESLIAHVKSSRPAPGFSEIMLPGEPEFRSAECRSRDGIEVDDTTWSRICKEAEAVNVDVSQWEALLTA